MQQRLLILIAFFSFTALCLSQTPPAPADYHSDPKFIKAYAKTKGTHEIDDELDLFKKADKAANGQCLECLRTIVKLQFTLEQWKDAAKSSQALEALAPTPKEKSSAAARVGVALLQQAGAKPKPEQLAAADAAFHQALALDDKNPTALYQGGRVLAMLGKDDEAHKQFETFIQVDSPDDPYVLRAKHFIQNPELVHETMAPAFTVNTRDGKTFSLDDMGGKVVLIDFWATWCGPCNEELPNVKKIARDFANEPFVLISVSWDNDAQKWQDFVDKNGMTWNQYRDADHKLSDAFGIDAIPHYFTIDSDGVLRAEVLGSGNDVEGKLKKLIAKAKAGQSTAQTTPRS